MRELQDHIPIWGATSSRSVLIRNAIELGLDKIEADLGLRPLPKKAKPKPKPKK